MNTSQLFSLAGTSMSVPHQKVSSLSIERERGFQEGHIYSLCGVKSRHLISTETQDEMAVSAAQQALDESGLSIDDIDLLIFTSSSGRQTVPYTAPIICSKLGAQNGAISSMDINTSCLSFLSGFDIGSSMLSSGKYKNIIIVSSEITSVAAPWDDDPAIAGMFGDGAAAFVLKQSDTEKQFQIRATNFETHPDGYDTCEVASGGTLLDLRRNDEEFRKGLYLRMKSLRFFKIVDRRMPQFLDKLLAKADWSIDDVDHVIPHQTNPNGLLKTLLKYGFDQNKMINIFSEYGNQSSASLPTAFHIASKDGRIKKGDKILMVCAAAGISFGGMAFIA